MKKLILIALLTTLSFGKDYYGCKNKADLENLKMVLEIGGMSLVKYQTENDCIETTKKWKDTKVDGDAVQRCTSNGLCYWFIK